MSVTTDQMIQAINQYYGPGNPAWDKIQLGTASYSDITYAFSQIPQMKAEVSAGGTYLGWDYADPVYLTKDDDVREILESVGSNYSGGKYGDGNSYQLQFPSDWSKDGDDYKVKGGGTLIGGSSAGSTLAMIADRASLAVTGVNLGAKLGAKIDEALYRLNPKWWDEHVPGFNPETWADIAIDENGEWFIRTLFGLPDNTPTGYMPADVMAYVYQMFRDMGVFDAEGYESTYTGSTASFPYPSETTVKSFQTANSIGAYNDYIIANGGAKIICFPDGTRKQIYVLSDTPGSTYRFDRYNKTTGALISSQTFTINTARTTFSGKTFYTDNTGATGPEVDIDTLPHSYTNNYLRQIGTVMFDGDTTPVGGIDGISRLDDSTWPDPSIITGTTIEEILQQLKQQYPQLFDGSVSTTTPQPDGSLKQKEYVPVPFAKTENLTDQQVTTGDMTQTDTDVSPELFDKITTKDPTDNPPDTGEGSTDSPVLPTGNASSLWAVYNPTQAELNSFGAWLWSSDFVEQLKKLFADPMQAIIGVHKVFATPSTGGEQTIKCGYLDSGVSSAVVTNQYTTVDCGSANMREYFGNVFDYEPFTNVSLFLPFIGVVPLNVSEVMRGTVSVKYKVDVITGACLAEVSISRDGENAILYTYGGSAIVSYPISSGSYVGVVGAAISTALGLGSAIASGGATALGSAGMILGGLSHAKTQVQHSGQFSGSAGAMGGKKPYLIVIRPQTRMASNVDNFLGIPSNAYAHVGSCNGFVRFKDIHLSIPRAYDNEVREIETLLKDGVII